MNSPSARARLCDSELGPPPGPGPWGGSSLPSHRFIREKAERANATQFVECETDPVRYVTRIERFVLGDYPMICVRSGLPATKMVPVQARRSTVWPWFLLPLSILWFVVAKWAADSDHPWGKLPFAEGHVDGITATYEKSIGVIIDGAHPAFVEATRKSQAAAQSRIVEQSEPVALGDPLIEDDRGPIAPERR
jgi:hypothetical protein